MTKTPHHIKLAVELRKRAMARLESNPLPPTDTAETKRLLHELQVHQIELEMQNEELLAARIATDAALERYTNLYDFAPIPYLTLTIDGAIRNANHTAARFLQKNRADLHGISLINLVADDSKALFNRFLANAITSQNQENCEIALQIKERTAWVVIQVMLDPSKAALLVAILDITERKRAEDGLKLAATVYQTLGEAIMVVDSRNIIVAINPAFTELTGYSNAEAIGQPASLLRSGWQDCNFYRDMWDALNRTGKWQGEICNRRKGGAEYIEWLVINTVYDKNGEVLRRIGVFSDITKQKQAAEIILQQANFDMLSGLPNRRLFQDRLEQEIKKAHRSGLKLALLFLDLDRFKDINDTLGHVMGDILLQEASQRLNACVREADTVARLGGDEFAIVMGELNDLIRTECVANSVLRAMEEPFQLGGDLGYVSASIGITVFPDDATEINDLLKKADQAMYAAKNQGRNRLCYFTPAMQDLARKRLKLANELRLALDNNQFWVAYQPIVEMATGHIHKAEALLRWQHPKEGLISPVDFIPIAEETGLITSIGDWVFHQAALQAQQWRRQYDPGFQISVNKSPAQFRNMPNSPAPWISHLQELGLSGQSIVVEITEGLLMDASETITQQLIAFHEAGMQVSLDDFGTGYSALSYLNKFDIDYLKIDQSFVRDLAPGTQHLALCEAIIVMSHKLGLKVIAEGIETTAQYDLLLAAGCDYGQGYLFSKPVPAPEFAKLLHRH